MDQPTHVDLKPIGSALCLACGLCCQGALHSHAVIEQSEIEHAVAIGLAVQQFHDGPGFHLPCPLHTDDRCSAYTTRPAVCAGYRCRVLTRYLVGAISLEQGLEIIQRTRELLADVIAHSPPACSYHQVRRELDQEWDSGRGAFGSAEMRQKNVGLLLALAKLMRYLRKHFLPSTSSDHRSRDLQRDELVGNESAESLAFTPYRENH